MKNSSEAPQEPIENCLSVVEQKLTEEHEMDPEDTPMIDEDEANPVYNLRNDPTGF